MLNLGNTGLNISTLVSSPSGHVIHVDYSKNYTTPNYTDWSTLFKPQLAV